MAWQEIAIRNSVKDRPNMKIELDELENQVRGCSIVDVKHKRVDVESHPT